MARRGLGADELRQADPAFLEAIRWVVFAEKLGPGLVAARRTADTDPPDELLNRGGAALVAFRAEREAARARVAELEPILYPADPEDDE